MPIRSHVDLCMFLRFLHIRAGDITDSARADLMGDGSPAAQARAWLDQRRANPRLFFHEGYHYWQGLRLPYLFWYATLVFRDAMSAFRQMAQHGDPLSIEFVADHFFRLSKKFNCWRTMKTLACGEASESPPGGVLDSIKISEIDLLENACSLAEWQTFSPEPTDFTAFSRWSKRNPSYVDAVNFAARCINDEILAIRIFLPLIAAAFRTTKPVLCFTLLLQTVIRRYQDADFRQFMAQKEPCRWDDVFEIFLKNIRFDAEPDASAEIQDDRFFLLNLRTWVFGGFGDFDGALAGHPFLSKSARKWMDVEKERPGLTSLLTMPRYVNQEAAAFATANFDPPITITRFHDKPNKVVIFGNEDGTYLPRESLLDIISMYSVVRRAGGAFLDPDHRLCWHDRCQYYGDNYCNSYMVIPDKHTECGFPKRIERLRNWSKSNGAA